MIRIGSGRNSLQGEKVKTSRYKLRLPSMPGDGRLRIDLVLISSHEKAKSVSCQIGIFWQAFRGFITIRIVRAFIFFMP